MTRFTLTPQRMRMIVEAFKDTLELGLEKKNQVVVRIILCPYSLPLPPPLCMFPLLPPMVWDSYDIHLLYLSRWPVMHGDGNVFGVRCSEGGRICPCHRHRSVSVDANPKSAPFGPYHLRISPPTTEDIRLTRPPGPRRGFTPPCSLCLLRSPCHCVHAVVVVLCGPGLI